MSNAYNNLAEVTYNALIHIRGTVATANDQLNFGSGGSNYHNTRNGSNCTVDNAGDSPILSDLTSRTYNQNTNNDHDNNMKTNTVITETNGAGIVVYYRWFKYGSTTSDQGILGEWGGGGSGEERILMKWLNSSQILLDFHTAAPGGASNITFDVPSGFTWTAGAWYLIALVYNKDNAASTAFRLLINDGATMKYFTSASFPSVASGGAWQSPGVTTFLVWGCRSIGGANSGTTQLSSDSKMGPAFVSFGQELFDTDFQTIYDAATTGIENSQSVSGSITPTGSLTESFGVSRSIAGSITPTGILSRIAATSKGLAGSITPTGAMTASLTFMKSIAGSITPTGLLSPHKSTGQAISGSITPTGILSAVANKIKGLAGSITPTGVLTAFIPPVPPVLALENIDYRNISKLRIIGSPLNPIVTASVDGIVCTFVNEPAGGSIIYVPTLTFPESVHRLNIATAAATYELYFNGVDTSQFTVKS